MSNIKVQRQTMMWPIKTEVVVPVLEVFLSNYKGRIPMSSGANHNTLLLCFLHSRVGVVQRICSSGLSIWWEKQINCRDVKVKHRKWSQLGICRECIHTSCIVCCKACSISILTYLWHNVLEYKKKEKTSQRILKTHSKKDQDQANG